MAVHSRVKGGKKQLLGEILLSRGLVSTDQLEQALEIQKTKKGFVGEILIDEGFVEEQDIVVALIIQCHLPYIAIEKYNIDEEVLKIIPRKYAQENKVVPLDKVGNILSVVMADPLDEIIKNELSTTSGCRIAPFIATKAEINKAIDRWFG